MSPDIVEAYMENMSALLRLDRRRYGLMVERQVMAQILPHLTGRKVAVLPLLFKLVTFCLYGADLQDFDLNEAQRQAVAKAVAEKQGLFPIAAAAAWQAFEKLDAEP